MIRSIQKKCLANIYSHNASNGWTPCFARTSSCLGNGIQRNIHTTIPLDADGMPIKMPSLSPTMTEGTIVKWMKQEGDSVQPGDILCDIQTDKAVMSLETDEEGILAKILYKDDSKDVKVGTLIALMVEEGEDWKSVEIPAESGGVESEQTSVTQESSLQGTENKSITHFGPSVRLLLEKYGLKENAVTPTGPHGSLLKGDVLNLISQQNLKPATLTTAPPPAAQAKTPETVLTKSTIQASSTESYSDIELTGMRKTIAKRLSQSKSSIAHTYSTLDCNIDGIINLRKKLKKDNINVSINDLVIKCVATALTRCPEINAVWQGDQLCYQKEVDISIAVATDAGLITPIIKGANNLGVIDISETIKDLAGRAKANKLKLDEFQGGTFTISNLGMFGIREFTAIINPPQCAILAVGGGRLELNEEGKPETRMSATLSYDQLAISDDAAASFMNNVHELLEDPMTVILGSRKKINHPMAALL